MVGEAIQKDMIGAKGTPLMRSPAMIGMTVHEQKGLKAPTKVANRMDVVTFALNARRIIPSSFRARTSTLSPMLMRNKGQTLQTFLPTNCMIAMISFIDDAPISYYYDG